MMKRIEKLMPFFEEIINEKTGQTQGIKVRHGWQSELWDKVNECINQINFIIEYLNSGGQSQNVENFVYIRPSWDQIVDSARGKEFIMCSCGTQIRDLETLENHYNLGHFDVKRKRD